MVTKTPMREARLYTIADFIRMTGLSKSKTRALLEQAGLVPHSNNSNNPNNRKIFISANEIRLKCPNLYWALRERLVESDNQNPPTARKPPKPPSQMPLFWLGVDDIVAETGLTRFQVRRMLKNAGLGRDTPRGARLRVLRSDLRTHAPLLYNIIEANRTALRDANRAIDRTFEGFGDDGDEDE